MIFIRCMVLIFFLFGVFRLLEYLIKVYFFKFLEVEAILVDCYRKSKHYDRNHIRVIKVKYIVDGKRYSYKYLSKYIKSIDDKVKILYNPKNPNDCIIKDEYLNLLLYIFVFAIILIIVFFS